MYKYLAIFLNNNKNNLLKERFLNSPLLKINLFKIYGKKNCYKSVIKFHNQ